MTHAGGDAGRREVLRVGVLHDLPVASGDDFATRLRRGFTEIHGAAPDAGIDVVSVVAEGTPRAGVEAVRVAMAELIRRDVDVVLGPAITDSAVAVLDLVDDAGMPAINYAGSQRARSAFMFQYQVGSLEEEPHLLAAHLARLGMRRVGLVHETSLIGGELVAFFEEAARREGLIIATAPSIAAGGDGATAAVAALEAAAVDVAVDVAVYLGLGLSARALGEAARGMRLTVVANSALMFGHAMPDWTALWEGWSYVDVIDEDNRVLAALCPESPDPAAALRFAIPYDLGRLLGAAVAAAGTRDRAGMRAALERVKRIPAALGRDGTVMGFGRWERSALKGEYLVLRRWRAGRSVRIDLPVPR